MDRTKTVSTELNGCAWVTHRRETGHQKHLGRLSRGLGQGAEGEGLPEHVQPVVPLLRASSRAEGGGYNHLQAVPRGKKTGGEH